MALKESEFPNPNGRFEANAKGQTTFVPKFLPPKISYESVVGLIAEAHMQLGVLEGTGNLLPHPDLSIRPYMTREAVSSSRIEGIESSNMDVFEFEVKGAHDSDGPSSALEAFNCVRASRSCLKTTIDGKRVDLEVLRHAHQILFDGTGYRGMEPGKIRAVQNWIGYLGSKIEDAIYVPPAVHLLDDLLTDLVRFVNSLPSEMPILVKCALAHYQFEAIHPFGDGNGRVGRLLILLILINSGALSKPILCLSAYFERNRTEYYERLRRVSRNGEWAEWLEFFLNGVIQCSREAVTVAYRLLDVRSAYDQKLKKNKVSANTFVLVRYLFANPVITIPAAAKYLKTGYPPAKKAVMYLVSAGILEQVGAKKRNKKYVAKEILDTFS